ncbi:hypothetical protein [Thermobispora bispora]|jgi:hypothetical protein|uniref:Uncharacterized protein n=1 Tax=Thermobispora bispora (strain ATCC 19993 / DSM 43833 / CBS 139.67 / JCM 10125 / KCTC 9307 / NBRC 14880 / R51) TaxID=469371 RepID=D6Y6L0_THEBD|nr:hypothetical protein [Thermobispora bispora]ADG87582.1 hypothetical protein Tbis_0858 [Thermobispora bispora DSM 43833]MBX6169107.1 hypothetical protein [Thermobispora bispora]MDI9579142.1 hypothetical protein [Thermobispora sp.]
MREEKDYEIGDEPDFAEEHTPSESDPPNAGPKEKLTGEPWDKPTEA